MKYALCLFFLVAFTACKKHDKTVQYAATCDLCFVEFQADNRTLKATTVEGNWRTFVVDTIIIGNQNVFIVDSIRAAGEWTYSTDLESDATPVLRARNAYRGGVARIRAVSDGDTTKAETVVYMETVQAQ